MDPMQSSCIQMLEDTKVKYNISSIDDSNPQNCLREVVDKTKQELKSNDEEILTLTQEEDLNNANIEIKNEADIEDIKCEIENHKGSKCEFTTTYFSSFQEHVNECDTISYEESCIINPIEHTCSVCGKTFNSVSNLRRHVRYHIEPFECYICCTSYCLENSLKRHMKIHTGLNSVESLVYTNASETSRSDASFKCTVCVQTFATNDELKKHRKTHSFECKTCDKVYRCFRNLKSHMRIHSGEQVFKCQVCGHVFCTSSNFKAHMRRHTGEKPFHCDVCNKSFTRSNILKTHKLRIHTGEETESIL